MKKLKFLDLEALQALNENSIRAGRSQHLHPDRLLKLKRGRYNLNFQVEHEWAGRSDVRVCVVLNINGQTAWLDISPEEFAAVPEMDATELEWEAVMCAGNPPPAP